MHPPVRRRQWPHGRLLTTLLLHKVGFDAGRYVSLEGIVEETKDGYYDSLRKSSAGWHEGAHSLQPWWEYLLGVVLLTDYRQLDLRLAGGDSQGGSKARLVERIVSSLPAMFVYSDIAVACPGVSRPTIMRVLRRLREQGQITCVSKGRKAVWRKV